MAAQKSLSLTLPPDQAVAIQREAAIEAGVSVSAFLAVAVQVFRMLSPADRLLARQLLVDGEDRRVQASLTHAFADLRLEASLTAAGAALVLAPDELAQLADAGDDAEALEDASLAIARTWTTARPR